MTAKYEPLVNTREVNMKVRQTNKKRLGGRSEREEKHTNNKQRRKKRREVKVRNREKLQS